MTSARTEDLDLRFGRLDSERDVVRELWFRPVALDVFLRWISGCSSLARLRPRDPTSADFSPTELRGTLGRRGKAWVLSLFGHDAGLLHEIAERALAEGIASVVVDGEAFIGEAPFFVFTARAPGQVTRPLWFDPLRGHTRDAEAIDALLTRWDLSLAAMIRSRHVSAMEELQGWVKFAGAGRVLVPPEWRPVDEPPPRWSISAVLPLVALSLVSIAFSTLFAAAADGLEAAPMLFSVLLVSWFAFLPLRLPFAFRVAWFVGLPLVCSVAVMFWRSP
ncbi:MAG: hypothetical protein ACO1OB_27840 [Archangium sp.]